MQVKISIVACALPDHVVITLIVGTIGYINYKKNPVSISLLCLFISDSIFCVKIIDMKFVLYFYADLKLLKFYNENPN